jgi:hypothetical protein
MLQEREYHEVTGDIICPSMVMGIDHIRDPRLNKVNKFHYPKKKRTIVTIVVL